MSRRYESPPRDHFRRHPRDPSPVRTQRPSSTFGPPSYAPRDYDRGASPPRSSYDSRDRDHDRDYDRERDHRDWDRDRDRRGYYSGPSRGRGRSDDWRTRPEPGRDSRHPGGDRWVPGDDRQDPRASRDSRYGTYPDRRAGYRASPERSSRDREWHRERGSFDERRDDRRPRGEWRDRERDDWERRERSRSPASSYRGQRPTHRHSESNSTTAGHEIGASSAHRPPPSTRSDRSNPTHDDKRQTEPNSNSQSHPDRPRSRSPRRSNYQDRRDSQVNSSPERGHASQDRAASSQSAKYPENDSRPQERTLDARATSVERMDVDLPSQIKADSSTPHPQPQHSTLTSDRDNLSKSQSSQHTPNARPSSSRAQSSTPVQPSSSSPSTIPTRPRIPTGPAAMSTPTHPSSKHPPTGPAARYPSNRYPPRTIENSTRQGGIPTGPAAMSAIPSAPRADRERKGTSNQQPPQRVATMPIIPVRKRESAAPDIDAEIARVRLQRQKLYSEHLNIQSGVRQALHELSLATLDLKAAEERRMVAEGQLDRASKGLPLSVFGIE